MTREVQNREEARTPESSGERRPRIVPAYEVWQKDGVITMRVEMPGLERDNVEITVENNQLTIIGRRPDWNVDGTFLVRERRVGDYVRAFNLDETIDSESIGATMQNGVLTLTLKVKEAAKPRRIAIKGE